MLNRVVFGNRLNQVYSIDVGSSHVTLGTHAGQSVVRERSLVSLAARRPPPAPRRKSGTRSSDPSRRAAEATEPVYRLHAIGSEAEWVEPPSAVNNGVRWVHPVDHGRIVDVGALELVLRKVMGRVRVNPIRKLLFGMRMTLLAPLHLEADERLRYQELLRDFGFGRIAQLDAPVAAAHGAGLDVTASLGQMLIDIGGGQTTIVAFTLGSIAAWSWSPTGGRNLDEAIAAYVLQRYRLVLHPALSERIKLALGSVHPRERPETLEIAGVDRDTGIEKKVTLDDNELRDVLADACEPLVMTIHQSFGDIAPELATDIAQGEILLVGGGALLSGLPQFLSERTGLRFRVAVDPINAAMRGAFASREVPEV